MTENLQYILAGWTPQGWEWIVIAFIAFLLVIPFWKICSKAGFKPWLSLLILVPVPFVSLIFLWYIAFSKWPALPQSSERDIG